MSLRLYETFIQYLDCKRLGTCDAEDAAKAMLDARLAKAEAAEQAVQALVVWMHDSTTKNWEPVMDALQEHADQGRVVRRLEEANKSD